MNFAFSESQAASLQKMADALGTTKAGVIQKALQLLATSRRELRSGNKIGVVKGGAILKEIVILA